MSKLDTVPLEEKCMLFTIGYNLVQNVLMCKTIHLCRPKHCGLHPYFSFNILVSFFIWKGNWPSCLLLGQGL